MSLRASHAFLIAAAIIATGCSGSAFEPEELDYTQQRSQCGPTDDSFDVELYDGSVPDFSVSFVATHEGAFGKKCSGSLIGPDLFLTASHGGCGVAVGEVVKFNCQVSASDPNPADPDSAAAANCESFVSTSIAFYPDIDVAISRLSGNPGYKYGWVFPTATPLSVGEPIAIFHHPLPGRRKKVSFGTVGELPGTYIHHNADTRGGSSGSGILNRAGLFVGTHTGEGCTPTGGQNSGRVMTAIIDQVPEVRGVLISGVAAAAL